MAAFCAAIFVEDVYCAGDASIAKQGFDSLLQNKVVVDFVKDMKKLAGN